MLLAIFLAPTGARAAEGDSAADRQTDRWQGTVTARNLNVRAGPGEGYPIVETLKRGDKVVAVDEVDRWVRLEGIGEDEAWAYRPFVRLPDDFMAPALGDLENDFIDWASERGDLAEFAIDSTRRLSIVLSETGDEEEAAAIAREIGCAWRTRMQLDEKVTVTVWPPNGPLSGWVAQATCP